MEVIAADLEPVAATERHQLTVMYRSPLGTHAPGAGKKFNFKLLGAPAEDPGLDFSR